jgi:hypothetical protein
VRIEVFNQSGLLMAMGDFPAPAKGRVSGLLTQYFPSPVGQNIGSGYIKIAADRPVAGFATFSTYDLTALSASPGQARQ